MHGSTSTTTIVLTASLAMITAAAAIFVHQAEHKEKQERKSDHNYTSSQLQYCDNQNRHDDDDDDDKNHREEGHTTSLSHFNHGSILERQPSTMSCRSKRDRIVIAEVEEKVKPPPALLISDGVPCYATMKNDSATSNLSRLSCPEGVDVSFETTHSVIEELSSCDNKEDDDDDEDDETSSSSSLLVAAHEKAANDDDDFAKSSLVLTTTDAESEWKGMKSFLILTFVWFVGVILATVLIGTTSFGEIYNWMEQVMITTMTTLEKNLDDYMIRRIVDETKEKEDNEALLSAVSTAVTIVTTSASRQIKGCYGPFVGDY